ncbi:MAG: hypothetical protein ABSB89_11050 [Candidatus Bathyarchaeia archaeon]|jgi:hypothetical protein
MRMKKCDHCGKLLDIDKPHYYTIRTEDGKTETLDFCRLECREAWYQQDALKHLEGR